MTPKEKAKELFEKFKSNIPPSYWLLAEYFYNYSQYKRAKQCALICVHEIVIKHYDDWDGYSEYWDEVIAEIEKL